MPDCGQAPDRRGRRCAFSESGRSIIDNGEVDASNVVSEWPEVDVERNQARPESAGLDAAALVTAALATPAAHWQIFEVAASARASGDHLLDTVLDDLAIRASAGNDAALELLIEVVHRLSLARPAITGLIFDAALIDDIAQETLMTLERRIGSFEGRAKFRTWLYAVARNEALMALRRRQSEPVEVSPGQITRFSSMVAGRLTIEALIDGLPEPYRETFKLQLFENLSYGAIAARLGVPIGTVRSRLAKSKGLLRAAVSGSIEPPR